MLEGIRTVSPTLPEAAPFSFSELFEPARRREQLEFCATTHAAVLNTPYPAPTIPTGSVERDRVFSITESITQEDIFQQSSSRRSRLFDRLAALAPSTTEKNLLFPSNPKIEAIQAEALSRGICLSQASFRLITSFVQLEDSLNPFHNPDSLRTAKRVITETSSSLLAKISNLSYVAKLLGAEDLEDENNAILADLRTLCQSPIYEALKHLPNNPFIALVHSIALNQYTGTHLRSSFQQISRSVCPQEPSLSQRIQSIWNRLYESGINNDIFSTLSHFSLKRFITIGLPLIALKIAQFFSLDWLSRLIGDERSVQRNTPGALFDTKMALRCATVNARTVALSAPTIGSQVSPEFRAALQALENRQYSDNPHDCVTWAYTNLQNMNYIPERTSSITLMKLQQEFPLSFRAITLPQSLPMAPNEDFSEHDVRHHLSLLFETTTTYGNKAGYFLPQPFLRLQGATIKAIAYRAFHIVARHTPTLPPEVLKVAYQKLFHIGLIRLHEADTYAQTAARLKQPTITAIRSTICASCIDRGGEMNTAFLCANDPSKDGQRFALGAYFGRAILNHRRSPTKASVENLSMLFSVINPEELYLFLSEIRA